MDQDVREVGLMVEFLSGYGAKILAGIARYVRQKPNWRVAFFERPRDELLNLVGSWEGDGIICSAVEPRFGDAASGRDIPIVNITSRQLDPVFLNVVGDDHAIGKKAAEFLFDRGFRHFAYVRRREPARYAADRWKGFSDALEGLGIMAYHLSLGPESDHELATLLEPLPRPLAVVAANDRLAAMVIETCRTLDINVPNDIAVLGIGNYELLCDLCSPTISSLDADMERRGYEAARWLDHLMQGKSRPSEPILIEPGPVIERGSTDSFAFTDPHVVKALRFIHEQAGHTIHVSDVVAASGISRRSLETRFSKCIPRTIHEEIWQAHFNLATRWLVTSDLALQEVAERSGFRTASALVNLFRQRFGQTPKEFRTARRR